MEPRITIAGGLNRHITRKEFVYEDGKNTVKTWVPKNADPSKTAKNVELVSREFTNSAGKTYELTLQQAVDQRLREAGIKRRKGQASCLEIIFTGSHDRMVAMSRNELMKWSADILKWAKKQWGEENVVSASLHVDERTPHIHMIVVPIVTGQSRRTKFHQEHKKSTKTYKINHDKLRLCKNEVYTKAKLYEYHDSLFQEVNKTYGLERGEFALPGSKKKHQDSIDYNRQLAEEAAERRSLLTEIQADYAEIQGDIQELQTKKDTLSSKVEEEQKKLDAAEAKTKEAEEESRKAEEKLNDLEGKIENNKGVIDRQKEVYDRQKEAIEKNKGIMDKQAADFNARKEELNQTKTEIAANKTTIAQQKQTISDNKATLQKQEKLKSSTVISDDAAEKKILEKLQTVKQLEAVEYRLSRSIVNKKTELATADANLQKKLRMIDAKADLDDVPKKGAFGYNSDKVTAFIESVEMASFKRAMYWTPTDIKVDTAIQEENDRLRKVEDDYKDFMNSPERLQQRIEFLQTEAKRRSIAEILKYALQKAVEVIRFTVDKTPKGEDIFAKFTINGSSTQYAGHITPDERISYTDKDLNSLQECKDNSREKIWWVLGSLSEIQAKREKEDTLSRYSTKLTTLLQERVSVTDYSREGKHYLLFVSNGRAYEVNPDGSTWSTGDKRVKTLEDCEKYSQEKIWTEHGNINYPPKISKGIHR